MLRHERSAPIWLFSFVDLAFLLLIAFTQIGPEVDASAEALVTLEVPRIRGQGTADPSVRAPAGWQLRILPPARVSSEKERRSPFRLIETAAATPERPDDSSLAAIDVDELAAQLAVLQQRSLPRPVLAPHRDARSEDLLVAVALLEDVWRGTRRVVVRPGPPVAAPPPAEARD